MADAAAAVKANDTGARWWEPLVAFGGGNVAAIVIMVVALLVAMTRGFTPADATALLTTNFMGIMGGVIVSDIVVLAIAWGLVRRRSASPAGVYFPAVSVWTVLMGVAAGAVLSLAVNGGNQLIDAAGWVHFQDTPTELAMVPHGTVQFAVSVFTVTLLAPLVEELIFRGLFLSWLLPVARVAGAVLISGLVFGLIHGQLYQHPGAQGALMTVELAGIGAVLGLAVVWTGSLRTSFAMHAAFNLTATILSVVWS